MSVPEGLVQAAAEAPCLRERRGDLTDGDCNGHITKHPECALAAAFGALPNITTQVVDESLTLTGCDRLRRRKYCCSYHEGMEDGLDVLLVALVREFGEASRPPWHCTTDGVAEPCGDCSGCRYDQSLAREFGEGT